MHPEDQERLQADLLRSAQELGPWQFEFRTGRTDGAVRWVAGADALRHNHALRRWAATRRDVSCVSIDMPLNRGVMAPDGFHPGAPVYRICANAIALHIAAVCHAHGAALLSRLPLGRSSLEGRELLKPVAGA